MPSITVNLKTLCGIYDEPRNGTVTRFLNEFFSEVVFASAFAKFLREHTGSSWKVISEVPTAGDTKRRLDNYVALTEPSDKGLYRNGEEFKIFACEVKGWNENSFPERRLEHYNEGSDGKNWWRCMSENYFQRKEPFAKLLHHWKLPRGYGGTCATQESLAIGLILYREVETSKPEDQIAPSAFWHMQENRLILVFSISRFFQSCLSVTNIEVTGENARMPAQKINALRRLGLLDWRLE